MEIDKGLKHISTIDPAFVEVIEHAGAIQLPPPQEPYESLVDSIVSQQLSVKAAATIMGRVRIAHENDISPLKTISIESQALRDAGLSRQKATYVKSIADAFIRNPHLGQELYSMKDQEVISSLTQIKGIGVWTAHMFMMFTLLREDVFPIGDLGIRRGMELFFFNGEKQEHSVLEKRASVWQPYRSIASLALWKAQS